MWWVYLRKGDHEEPGVDGIITLGWIFKKDFWIRDTGTGQQVAKLHERYMMMMMMMMIFKKWDRGMD